MNQFDNQMSRRDALGALGCLIPLSALGVAVLGVRGCTIAFQNTTLEAYQQAGKSLQEKFTNYYPDGKIENFQNPLASIKTAEKALAAYGAMLSVRCPYDSDGKPLLNAIAEGHAMTDSYMDINDLRENGDFNALEKDCQQYRALFSKTLRDCRSAIQDYQATPEVAADKTILQYVGSIVLRLDRLSSAIDEGTLMTRDNIINRTNKFGTFTKLVGHVDHYDDCISELRSLREYLERRERSGGRI